MTESLAAGRQELEQYLRTHILILKHEAERELTGNGWALEISKLTRNGMSPPKTILPNPSQTVPQTRNQAFKPMRLWDHSLSNNHTWTLAISSGGWGLSGLTLVWHK